VSISPVDKEATFSPTVSYPSPHTLKVIYASATDYFNIKLKKFYSEIK
jgi:hypothetical protein